MGGALKEGFCEKGKLLFQVQPIRMAVGFLIRMKPREMDLAGWAVLFKGDGRTYKFMLRMGEAP